MKTLKPRAGKRPTPEEALAAAAEAAPRQPPATLTDERATTLNLRVKASTIEALAKVAGERGMTLKQVVAHALKAAGVAVAASDLEDRTPRRRL